MAAARPDGARAGGTSAQTDDPVSRPVSTPNRAGLNMTGDISVRGTKSAACCLGDSWLTSGVSPVSRRFVSGKVLAR
jgi:hypothetical protein